MLTLAFHRTISKDFNKHLEGMRPQTLPTVAEDLSKQTNIEDSNLILFFMNTFRDTCLSTINEAQLDARFSDEETLLLRLVWRVSQIKDRGAVKTGAGIFFEELLNHLARSIFALIDENGTYFSSSQSPERLTNLLPLQVPLKV